MVLSTVTVHMWPDNWFLMLQAASQAGTVKECIQTQSMFLFWTMLKEHVETIFLSSTCISSIWAVKIPKKMCLHLCVCCCYAMLIPLQVYHDDVFTDLHWGHQLLFSPDGSCLNICLSVWSNFGDRVQFDRHWKFVLINTNLNLSFNQKTKRQFVNN